MKYDPICECGHVYISHGHTEGPLCDVVWGCPCPGFKDIDECLVEELIGAIVERDHDHHPEHREEDALPNTRLIRS